MFGESPCIDDQMPVLGVRDSLRVALEQSRVINHNNIHLYAI